LNLTVRDNPAASQYEVFDGDRRRGLVQYRRAPDRISFIHTEIEPEAQGRGVASTLIGFALAEAAEAGLAVLPFCPFVRRYIAERSELLELVPPDRRAAFGLESAEEGGTPAS
jgi:predicted GNAT family acetyltransferase